MLKYVLNDHSTVLACRMNASGRPDVDGLIMIITNFIPLQYNADSQTLMSQKARLFVTRATEPLCLLSFERREGKRWSTNG